MVPAEGEENMGIGLSGMISGLDTDSIVKAMVSAQQTKATKIENKITLNKWTTEAWSSLNTKIYSFYTKYASKLRLQSSYMTRTAKSSDESKVTAKAGSSAAVGTHNLQIKSLASSQYVTGAKLGKADTYNKNSKLTEMGAGVKAGTIITITGNTGADNEKVTKLEVTENTTVNDFLNACKSSGLTASFDTTQQRFFISSSQSGKDDAFTITTSQLSADTATAFDSLTKSVDASALSATEKTAYDNAMTTLRQNTDVINKVLSADYDESNKTQKAVYDAITTVKDAAVKTQEKRLADASAKQAAKDADKEIEDALLTAEGKPTEAVSYGSNMRTFEELLNTATQNITEKNEATAKAAGSSAIAKADFTKESGKTYATLDFVNPEKYAETATTFATAKDSQDNLIADTPEKIADLESKIGDLQEAGTIDAATAAALKEAYAVKNTWEAEYTVTDESGTTITTVGATYESAYQASKTASGATLAADVTAEMVALVKADQKETYDTKVAEKTEALIAADTTTPDDTKAAVDALLTTAGTNGTTASNGGIAALGLGEVTGKAISDGGANGMAVVAAANAEFVLDGATMEETSNNFTVNGITLNLVSTTYNKDTKEYDNIQITVGKDSDSTYELVKEALTEYNKLIEEMNDLYGAASARGYDPLTSEQKEAMTEEEIENWEGKIKGSLLRRDSTLGSLLTSMRTALASSYTDEETGKIYSLSSFGIVTGNYTENGKLHIYGDTDDATYATYTDRLKTALEDDPDQVMDVLTNIFGKLYETMTEKCAKTEISSALTFYNDKQYSSLLEDYEDDLETMEDRIKDLEDKYYKQFTAMETALSKLQSQSNSLASLLGTNTQ